jgi:hypothetical protein
MPVCFLKKVQNCVALQKPKATAIFSKLSFEPFSSIFASLHTASSSHSLVVLKPNFFHTAKTPFILKVQKHFFPFYAISPPVG